MVRLRLLPLLLLVACDGGSQAPSSVVDAGSGPLICQSTADCQGTGVCVGGLCEAVDTCEDDSDCAAAGLVCHRQRLFCVECDGRPGQCAEGQTCQFDFTCVATEPPTDPSDGCSDPCADRAACAPDRVCRNGTCCPPPSRCASPEDCPESSPECNGATGQCFGGSGCFQDDDCETEPGCAGDGCFCDIQGAPPGTCRVRPNACDDDMDCWDNGSFARRYCALSAQPRRCLAAPPCTRDLDCANLGLICDLTPGSPSEGFCQNGRACTGPSDCEPAQVCVGGRCAGANCVNQPSLCAAGETCDPSTGQCVPAQSSGCTRNEDCPQGQFCNVQVNPPACQPGCRSNADCPPNGRCNAMNQCEFPSNSICGPCTTDSDCPGGTQCQGIDSLGLTFCLQPCLLNLTRCSLPGATCALLYCTCPF